MGTSSYLTALTTVMTKTSQISDLEMRLMKISAEKMLKHAHGSAKVSELTSEMSAILNNLRKSLGENYTSEDYKAYMAESESIENEYTMQINALRDQMHEAETKLDAQQETVQVQLQVQRAELDEWKKLAQQKASNVGYFKN